MARPEQMRLQREWLMPITGDAAMAMHGVVGGRLVPLIMVDTMTRADVAELLRIHKDLGPGDCKTRWGTRARDTVVLVLSFERPIELSFAIPFDIHHFGLVDQILTARALYLQHGKPGNRLVATMDYPRVLIEVPPSGFEERWEQLLRNALTRDFRSKGLSRKAARSAAVEFITEWRELGGLRMK